MKFISLLFVCLTVTVSLTVNLFLQSHCYAEGIIMSSKEAEGSSNPFLIDMNEPPQKDLKPDQNKTSLVIIRANKEKPNKVTAIGEFSYIFFLSDTETSIVPLHTSPGAKIMIKLAKDSPGKNVEILGKSCSDGKYYIDKDGNLRPIADR